MLNLVYVEARDIPEAWFLCVDKVLSEGRTWTVQHGSYEGEERCELDYITLRIKYPGTRPLVPEIRLGLDIPRPATLTLDEQEKEGTLSLEGYLPYMMTYAEPKENETYTYGKRLFGYGVDSDLERSQVEEVIRKYKTYGYGTNQCTMSISRPEDIHLSDPPCLRSLDCRIFPDECLNDKETSSLHFFVYMRSWDCWGGLPLNLAAIRMLQEYMAEEIGVGAGEIVASSKGLHLYGHSLSLAKKLVCAL